MASDKAARVKSDSTESTLEYGSAGKSPGPYIPGTSWATWLRLFEIYLELKRILENQEAKVLCNEVGTGNYVYVFGRHTKRGLT